MQDLADENAPRGRAQSEEAELEKQPRNESAREDFQMQDLADENAPREWAQSEEAELE